MISFLDLAQEIEAAQFNLTSRPFKEGASYSATELPGDSRAFAAVTAKGDFAILIPLSESSPSVFEEQLESISISFNQHYIIDVAGVRTAESAFAAIALHRDHLELLTGFASLAAVLLHALPAELTAAQLLVLLEDFRELFTARREVNRDVIKGLWGELWLMSQMPDPSQLVIAWHTGATDIFDFSLPNGRVEVKTTETEMRQHHFSLRQLEPGGNPIWVASLRIQPESAGTTLAELLALVSSKVSRDIEPQLARKCLAVIAGDLEALSDYRFVVAESEALRMISSMDIPRVVVPDGVGISGVSFSVVLQSTPHDSNPFELLDSLSAVQAGPTIQ